MAKQLFRKVSLERLSSPEQLDQLIQVTSPRGWLALAALGFLIVWGVIWSIVGRIPEKISGRGILIKSGGIHEIVAPGAGVLDELYVKAGDDIRPGQVLARINQPALLEKLRSTRQDVADLRLQYQNSQDLAVIEESQQMKSSAKQRAALVERVRATEQTIEWLTVQVKESEGLLKKGLITRQDLVNTKQQLDSAKQTLLTTQASLGDLSLALTRLKAQQARDAASMKNQLANAETTLLQDEMQYEDTSRVVSPYQGRVVEVDIDANSLVTAGTGVLKLELTGDAVQSLQAIIFLPPGSGKKAHLAMDVQVSPSTVEQETYGFMRGIVTRVAEYPASRSSMMELLQDDALVELLMAGGAPIRVETDLIPDPRTPSGYKWSTSDGPSMRLQPGTMAICSVVLDERSPISMLIPYVKNQVLGVGEAAAVK